MDGYGQGFPRLGVGRRAEYFADTGLQPITTYIEMIREENRLEVDESVAIRFSTTYGFVPGWDDGPPRYGGTDSIVFFGRGGSRIVLWRQHWLWHLVQTGALLHEPAPDLAVEQDEELARGPRRPAVSRSPAPGRFRWTPRETDINRHVSTLGYLERAENALADSGEDLFGITTVRMWFRRASTIGDEMLSHVGRQEDALLIELRRAGSDDVCTIIACLVG